MPGTYKTEGIIISRTNFGEADRILTVLSKHYGKIRLVAKGVRRMISRKGGNVELFNHVDLFIARGRNLDIITEVQVKNAHTAWRKNLEAVATAYYLAELVDRLTAEGEKNQTVFFLLSSSLGKISPNQAKNEKLIEDFQKQLLLQLGFGIPEGIPQDEAGFRAYIEKIIERKLKSPNIRERISHA